MYSKNCANFNKIEVVNQGLYKVIIIGNCQLQTKLADTITVTLFWILYVVLCKCFQHVFLR